MSKQRYDKPNRGAAATTTTDSDTQELDTFFISQAQWNLVLSDRMFLDTRLSYNNTHFPLLQKTDLQSINDTTQGIRYRNASSSALMFRRRLEATSNWQYFIPRMLGGRHEFKAGFDNGYTPEDVTTSRTDNVNLTFTSSNGLPAQVTIFNSPTLTKTAVMTTALYGQDSYSIKRLTVVGGIRWERVEGYVPAQTAVNDQYFAPGVTFNTATFTYTLPDATRQTVTGPYTVPGSYDAVHGDPLWYNFAPRFSVTYDLLGDGKTIAKMSVGRYLDQIGTGTPINPYGRISQTYAWADNGDYVFQPGTPVWNGTQYVGGELGALSSSSIANPYGPLTFNKSLKRPTRNEFTIGVDREMIPNLLLSATFIHRREHNVQATLDQSPDLWGAEYTLVTLTDPGRDGVAGTADDQSLQAYSLNPGNTITTITVNDDRLAQHYNGVELSLTKRMSKGWTALVGYDYSHTRQDLISLSNPNNAFVNAGGISGGRRHIFNGSASYTLPWYHILVGTEFRLQSGLPITRTWTPATCSATIVSNCLNQSQSLNAETRGTVELPWLSSADLRVGKTFAIRRNSLDLSMDVYNVTNANTVFSVRTGTGTTTVRYGGSLDPSAPTATFQQFLLPTGILGPRILRFNMTYSFGGK